MVAWLWAMGAWTSLAWMKVKSGIVPFSPPPQGVRETRMTIAVNDEETDLLKLHGQACVVVEQMHPQTLKVVPGAVKPGGVPQRTSGLDEPQRRAPVSGLQFSCRQRLIFGRGRATGYAND